MERKQIDELTKLKLQNSNLSLQILQMQANQIMAERDRLLKEEFESLECNPAEWKLDERTWELLEVGKDRE